MVSLVAYFSVGFCCLIGVLRGDAVVADAMLYVRRAGHLSLPQPPPVDEDIELTVGLPALRTGAGPSRDAAAQ